MTSENKSEQIFYSLIVPNNTDTEIFQSHITKVCSVLDNHIPNYYEVIAIDGVDKDVPKKDWDRVKGEVLVIIDGDMKCEPTLLCDVVDAFKTGSDMAFAGQYQDQQGEENDNPTLSYFGIRRSALSRIHESPEGYKIILEILGPDTIAKLSTSPTKISDNYILHHLRQMIGLGN